LSDDAFQKLDLLQADKSRLNEYSQAIFTKITPLGRTIYEVNGYLANLQSYDEVIFSVDSIRQTSQQTFNQYINVLTRFADTIGNMSNDYRFNPWKGANIDFVTNEIRHDIGAYIHKAIPKSIQITTLCDEIASALGLDFDCSYIGLQKTVSLLELASHSPKVPASWIMETLIEPLFEEIDIYNSLKTEYENTKADIIKLHKNITENNSSIKLSYYENLTTTNEIDEHRTEIESIIATSPHYSVWNSLNDWPHILSRFEEASKRVEDYHSVKTEILREFEKEIFDIDYDGMYLRFKSEYTSLLRIFKNQYKTDKKLIRSVHKEIIKKISDEDILQILNKLRQFGEIKSWMSESADSFAAVFGELYKAENTNFDAIKMEMSAYTLLLECSEKLLSLRSIVARFEEQEDSLKKHYDFLYAGVETDWEHIIKALNWAKEFKALLCNLEQNKKFAVSVCSDDKQIKLCGDYSRDLGDQLNTFKIVFNWFLKLFDNPDELCTIRMPALTDRLQNCVNGLAALEEWIDYRNTRKQCCDIGLEDYIEKIEKMDIKASCIIPIFKKRFFRLWLDAILSEYPVVANFRRRVQEKTINEFAALDKLQFEIAKARIRSRLINDLPSLDHFTSGVDEISILRRELNKQRRIMPIRKLFKAIPNLILTLKPCLMMSPLSVSLFLEADSFIFDTVIFDEASQVCTENAIGAISRGKQVIIAGDSKQLPPTNFFSATTSSADYDIDEEDDDEYDSADAYESILDEAALLPERTLLWHYRSRHEHLIAFSNAKIYRNNLITFPSNVGKVTDSGVEYIYVQDGFYDRGGKKGNVIEASKIADLVFEHFEKYPNRTLGVIAFGEVQQQAIDTAIRKKRMDHQQFEEFFNEDKHEPFFIKNLENVQGDERDTIIFSIGYAKDAAGKMHMNFGPLSKAGGERRLNVAITRAKYNVKLVGSILPTDIDTEKITRDGPKLLRGYIDYAINGPSILQREINESDIVEHDSPFEAAVYNFLDRRGYKLGTQVGCSGYRIDMAVKHPSINGRYVLGIECDGAAYHSARTARERDRLRQSVLEDMGWKIYRIWSTDWIKDPVTEGERLIEVVEKAINDYQEELPQLNKQQKECDESKDFLTVEEKKPSVKDISNPYGFAQPAPTQFNTLPKDRNGYVQMSDCIELLVKNEFPIHYELLCKKLCSLLGREKATSVVRREVDYALARMKNRVIRKGDFFYPAKYTDIPVRTPNGRSIKYISTDELAAAMYIIASKCIGATKETLIDETTRAFGFSRRGANITEAMEKAYEKLITNERIVEVDKKVAIS
jgi:very-short-patch-repair endonuclease